MPDEKQTEIKGIPRVLAPLVDVAFRGSGLASEGPRFSSLHGAISLPQPIKCFYFLLAAIHLLSISCDQRGLGGWERGWGGELRRSSTFVDVPSS